MKVFSFCLYGPFNRMYYHGLLDNLDIIGRYYPDWKVFVYVGADVTSEFLERLRDHPRVVLRETHEVGAVNMIHRFFAIDESDVEVMVVRDADSRVHWKDRWAIQAFLESPYIAHTVRDNRVHGAVMMGGIWGMRNCGLSIRELYDEFRTRSVTRVHGYDQDFLTHCVHPRLHDHLLVIVGGEAPTYPGEHVLRFPFVWRNDIYCGRVESV